MKHRRMPFRLKIALYTALLSGGLLVAFGYLLLDSARQQALQRVDEELATLASAQLLSRRPLEHWRSLDNSLRLIYGENYGQQIAVIIRGPNGTVLFQTEGAPTELTEFSKMAPPLPEPPNFEPPPSGPGPMPGRPGPPPILFERLDADGDGQLSLTEWPRSERSFHLLDQNEDGLLSLEELTPLPPTPGRGWWAGEGPRLRDSSPGPPVFQLLETSDHRWRAGLFSNSIVQLAMARNLSELSADFRRLLETYALLAALGVTLIGFIGWWLAGRMLRPVATIRRTAEAISGSDLARRAKVDEADPELARLVDVINAMLARLETSFHQARRFSADAAHELQTPLAVLQGELDIALQAAAPGSAEQKRTASLLDEVQRLKTLVSRLLLLAQADSAEMPLSPQQMNLTPLLRSLAEDFTEETDLQLELDLPPELPVMADEPMITLCLSNLLRNAVKYNRPGGRITISAATEGVIHIRIFNTGEPIPEAMRERIFERFFRLDKARERQTGGAGLGLSLAREIALAHGGRLTAESGSDGNTFCLVMPSTD